MNTEFLPRLDLTIPPKRQRSGIIVRVLRSLAGAILTPVCWLLAKRSALPGLDIQRDCARLGLRLLVRRRAPIGLNWIKHLIVSPVVLTRYFEYDFAWRRLSSLKIGRYLDVSSPFAFPILLVDRMPKVTADLVNPDGNDLPTTRAIACAAGLDRRCRFLQAVVDDIDAPPSSYDAVTCISVLEHIPDDRAALQRMWSLLRPGGTLIITVPCAARSYRLFTNRDHYGLLGSGEDGFTFLEYVYDEAQLAERVYAVTGSPAATEIWGEREPGFLSRELASRWSGAAWRYWEEPLLMARAFARYAKISELPGEGVVSLSFVKP